MQDPKEGVRARRYKISVATDGSETSKTFIGNEPSCAGWLLSFRVDLPAGSMISANMVCRDNWEGSTGGLEFSSWLVLAGGQLFVPYPSLDLTFTDFLSGGGGTETTIFLTARSVSRATQVDHSASVLYGLSGPKTVNSGATETFEVPDGASGYQVGIGTAGGDWTIVEKIDPGGGIGDLVLASYSVEFGESNSGDVGGQNWRLVVPASDVSAKNEHGSASGTINLFWQYQLRKLY